ncbi:hypothetical protein [Leisingera methylohalidivorans]|uniref:Uncharacterized protein n=1 Tax=Leisingera methylohalidivorans DSM 14336 TaxID=999552 RepID=V9VZT9_9RHOB|nr:hypothetical protein [Leisingera methylohalidivorans]AHD02890.1 hypothetical protein METH_04770 [Leisingera methylohalidivorans DSM 14336]
MQGNFSKICENSVNDPQIGGQSWKAECGLLTSCASGQAGSEASDEAGDETGAFRRGSGEGLLDAGFSDAARDV